MRLKTHVIVTGWLGLVCLFLIGVSSAPLLPQETPAVPLACGPVGSNVFVGCYYNGTDLNVLKAVRTDSTIDFDWNSGSPDPSITADNFSVKWEGDFSFSTTGTYRFTTSVDDGIRLYVDNAVLLDKWFDQPLTTYTVDASLTEGTHRIKAEYYQHGGPALVQISCMLVELSSSADAVKGVWGRVTPIADDHHPNLYYNQSEIDELRNMILVQHAPQHLYDLYNSEIRNVSATPAAPRSADPDPAYYTYVGNMKAAVSYMIEPTSAKADAIHSSMLSYMNQFPDGLPDFSIPSGAAFAGYNLPWFFDLLMAYNPEKLSAEETTHLKNWFALSAAACCSYIGGRYPGAPVYDGEDQRLIQEGEKTVQSMANWWSRFMGPSLALALVSGNQDAVDFWADSGWPHDLFTTEKVTATYPAPGTNRFDLVTYLLAVLPSGANTDTYLREGFRLAQKDWDTVDYTWGSYHFAEMYGAILGAEMVYHNGMTGVFGITDAPGTEPALLRTYKRAIESRTETDTQRANPTGHPIIGWDPALFAGYRRYSDSTIEAAIPGVISYAGPIPAGGDGGIVRRGFDVPGDVWAFFGYPRRIAWTGAAIDPTLPSVTGVTVSKAIVPAGSSYSVSFTGSNLNSPMYFDVRFRFPGGNGEAEVSNWQFGNPVSHDVPLDTAAGIWSITGVRAHRAETDHSGSFNAVSAAITVPVF